MAKKKIIINRRVLIEASVQELAEDDIRDMIDKDVYRDIKAKDKHPLFVKLNAGKQGVSGGSVMFGGIKRLMQKIWSATRMKELARWLGRGVKLFVYHNKDSSHTGRRKVGETIHGWTENIKGELHALGIGYIPSTAGDVQEMIRTKKLDTCSIEADLRFSLSKLGRLFVDRIQKLTAVALGSTQEGQMPGFATAGIVGMVQEMSEIEEVIKEALLERGIDLDDVEIVDVAPEPGERGKKKIVRKGGKMGDELTLEDVEAYIKRMKVQPEVLFPIETLLKVKSVSDALDNEAGERVDVVEASKSEEIDGLKTEIASNKTAISERDQAAKDKEAELKIRDEKIRKLTDQIIPYKEAEKKQELAGIVMKSKLLRDVEQEKADYVASHINIPSDLSLESDDVAEKIDEAIQAQLDDIEKSGIKFEPKPQEEEEEEEEAPVPPANEETWKAGEPNPLIPSNVKK